MFSSQPIDLAPVQNRTASIARDRLLHDQATRRNKAPLPGFSPLPAPPITKTFAAQDARRALSAPWSFHHLSPLDQKREAIQIARSFRSHYVAEITYHDDHQTTIARLRPIHVRHHGLDVPHEIHVDASGNVNVSSCEPPEAPTRPFAIGWVLLAAGASLIIAGVLLLLV
jgi:hypothetical protein